MQMSETTTPLPPNRRRFIKSSLWHLKVLKTLSVTVQQQIAARIAFDARHSLPTSWSDENDSISVF
jgi:hypothetical protein